MKRNERRLNEVERDAFIQNFVDRVIKRKPEADLRRIADAYETAHDFEQQFGAARAEKEFPRMLREQGIEGYMVGRGIVSYKQARVVYELVRLGRYGGLRNLGETVGPMALPGKRILPEMSDGCFPFDERDPSVHLVPKDSMEDYRNRRDAELITA